MRIAVLSGAFPRGYDEDLDSRAPRDGPGGRVPDLEARTPRNGQGGPLRRRLVWFVGANGATQEAGREHRQSAGASSADRATGFPRNLQERRHGVHSV